MSRVERSPRLGGVPCCGVCLASGAGLRALCWRGAWCSCFRSRSGRRTLYGAGRSGLASGAGLVAGRAGSTDLVSGGASGRAAGCATWLSGRADGRVAGRSPLPWRILGGVPRLGAGSLGRVSGRAAVGRSPGRTVGAGCSGRAAFAGLTAGRSLGALDCPSITLPDIGRRSVTGRCWLPCLNSRSRRWSGLTRPSRCWLTGPCCGCGLAWSYRRCWLTRSRSGQCRNISTPLSGACDDWLCSGCSNLSNCRNRCSAGRCRRYSLTHCSVIIRLISLSRMLFQICLSSCNRHGGRRRRFSCYDLPSGAPVLKAAARGHVLQ